LIYDVRHRTTYRYEGMVTFARCQLRLTPPSTPGQSVLSSAVAVTPKPSTRQTRTGPFGEQVITVIIDHPHRVLIVDARSKVDVHAQSVDDPAASRPWETVAVAALQSRLLGPDGPAAYLYPTPRTPLTPAITDYARQDFPPGRPVIEAAMALMSRIYGDFTYDSKATTVSTPAADAFKSRHGVCQDFSHIMIAGLRGLGLPAAYVSGYLRTIPPPGKPRLAGADATHAWVNLWCGDDRGWIGFDPTNAILAQNDHITLAVGRDYGDVAPIDGIMLGPGEQALKVEVDVIPQGEKVAVE
jgi:transglutaminase-like putative cysteine protease